MVTDHHEQQAAADGPTTMHEPTSGATVEQHSDETSDASEVRR